LYLGSSGSPSQRLEIDGGVMLNPGGATVQPACAAATRGLLWYVRSVTDALQVCRCTSSGGVCAWATIA
jgi:hypothetical protein